MRIVHVAPFAPGRCGLYETTAELIMAERALGHEVDLVDAGIPGEDPRVGIPDPIHGVTAWGPDAARGADLIVSHTGMPKAVLELTDAPIVHVLHGRPEGSFRLQQAGKSPVYNMVDKWAKSSRYVAFVTLWPEYRHYWRALVPERKLHVVSPPPVDLQRFKPTGKPYEFQPPGAPNVVVADVWREDVSPLHVISALSCPEVHEAAPGMRVHIYALKSPLGAMHLVLRRLLASGHAGEFKGMMKGMSLILRAADVVVTPHRIATRVIREALASGTPVIAREGCTWTPYRFDPEVPSTLVEPLRRILLDRGAGTEARELAQVFDHLAFGRSFLALCEGVLGGALAEAA